MWNSFIKKRIEIDHVILFFYLGNDIIDSSKKNLDLNGNVKTQKIKHPWLKGNIDYFRNFSVFTNFIYIRLYLLKKQFSKQFVFEKKGEINEVSNIKFSKDLSFTISFIKKWGLELNKSGKKFTILYFNNKLSKKDDDFIRMIRKTCEELNWEQYYIKFPDYSSEYFFEGKGGLGHFNNNGHRLVYNQMKNIILNLEK